MKKIAIAAATALTLTLANGAFAATEATHTQSPAQKVETGTKDTWITTKVKSDLLTEKNIPGSDIKVETSHGVVSLSSDVKVTASQKAEAVRITKNIKGVKSVMSDGLKAE